MGLMNPLLSIVNTSSILLQTLLTFTRQMYSISKQTTKNKRNERTNC